MRYCIIWPIPTVIHVNSRNCGESNRIHGTEKSWDKSTNRLIETSSGDSGPCYGRSASLSGNQTHATATCVKINSWVVAYSCQTLGIIGSRTIWHGWGRSATLCGNKTHATTNRLKTNDAYKKSYGHLHRKRGLFIVFIFSQFNFLWCTQPIF